MQQQNSTSIVHQSIFYQTLKEFEDYYHLCTAELGWCKATINGKGGSNSAPIECVCVWSAAGNIVTKKCSALDSNVVQDLLFCHENMIIYKHK